MTLRALGGEFRPEDYANLAVSMSQLLERNVILGTYDGATLFADRLLPMEDMVITWNDSSEASQFGPWVKAPNEHAP